MSTVELEDFEIWNPEELLKFDWKKISQRVEDLIFERGRLHGYFEDVENFGIIFDYEFKKNEEGKISEYMTVIISTDGTNLYDLEDMQEAIQDDISDYHLDEIMEEVCKENNIPKYYISENIDTGRIDAPPIYYFEIRKWE